VDHADEAREVCHYSLHSSNSTGLDIIAADRTLAA
jgi:hypothetical protein